MELQPYQQQVLDELNDLDTKMEKLNTFITSPAFDLVGQDHQVLLKVQFVHMQSYLSTLAARLDLWGYWESCADLEEEVF